MAKDKTKTLFFINGPAPTAEQREEAASLSGIVCFRNAFYATQEDGVEPFDKLAGDPPAHYCAVEAAKKGVARAAGVTEAPKVEGDAAAALAAQSRQGSGGWAPNS